MLSAFIKAFAQLGDRRLMRVLWLSLGLAVLIYTGLIAGIAALLTQAWVRDLPLIGEIAAFGAGFGAVVIATLLFPGIVTAFVGLFLEDVAAAVEARHYPGLALARRIPVGEAVATSAQLALTTIAVNVVLLPLYIALIFIPPLNLVVYYAVNGRLLGREYFETIGLRRMQKTEARMFARQHSKALWAAGAITAFLLTVPVLNMIAPVIGAAAMVHVFQKLTRAV